MAMAVADATRVFKYDGKTLADPNPALSPEEVMEIYADVHPELINGSLSPPELDDEGNVVYTISKVFGQKG